MKDGVTSSYWTGNGHFAAAVIVAFSLLMGPAAYAQDGSDDLTSMSLEELMQIDIVPIGILETHIHLDGQWMVGYQFMKMNMSASGQPDGSYMMHPESMWMDMHMVMLMYGLTDDLTLMAMIPYQNSVMEMTDMMGMHMSSSSAGLRDILLMGHYALVRQSKNYVIGGAGITLPSGSIDASQPGAAERRKLGYGMQLGAGVPELALDMTLVHQSDIISAGAHVEGQWSFGRNGNGYRLGDRYHTGVWITVKTANWFAPSLHLDVDHQLPITGFDPDITAARSPANDPSRYGGTHVSLTPGLTIYAPGGALRGQRLTAKLDYPLFERHSATFLEQRWSLVTAWQWSF